MNRRTLGLCGLLLAAGCGAHMRGTVTATTTPSIGEAHTRGDIVPNAPVEIVHHTCNTGRAANAARRHCDATPGGLATVVDVLDAHHVRVRAVGRATLREGDTIAAISN